MVICRSKPVDYNSIAKIEKHFLSKLLELDSPIVERKQILGTVNAILIECDARQQLFQKAGVKIIGDYNIIFVDRKLDPEQGHRFLPMIVLILDDLQTFLNIYTTSNDELLINFELLQH